MLKKLCKYITYIFATVVFLIVEGQSKIYRTKISSVFFPGWEHEQLPNLGDFGRRSIAFRREPYDPQPFDTVSGEVCKPICKSNCTNGYCKHPEECACNAGYTKGNDSCVPVCEGDCSHGTCVAPNTCRCESGYNTVNETCVKEHISRSSNEDTTTTTKDPFNMRSTDNHYYNQTENTTTATTTSPVPYFVSSSSSTQRVVDNDANTTVTSGDPIEKSWMQQHGMFIWIPIIVIVTTGLILLLIWRRTPMIIINFFRGRSYNVQGAFLQRNGASSFERLEFITDE